VVEGLNRGMEAGMMSDLKAASAESVVGIGPEKYGRCYTGARRSSPRLSATCHNRGRCGRLRCGLGSHRRSRAASESSFAVFPLYRALIDDGRGGEKWLIS
jgi:hypothetical protein